MTETLLLVDDEPELLAVLRRGFEQHAYRVETALDGTTALALARELRPTVVLMDLDMPGVDGLTATRLIKAELPDLHVVVLTASEAEADLFEAIKSGAQGYLLKNLEADEFFQALASVMAGEPVLTPRLARRLLQELAQRPAAQEQAAALTDREREILELLVQGVTSNRELAERLFISENTVKYHLKNILGKLHLQNRAQVVAYALKHGLVPPSS